MIPALRAHLLADTAIAAIVGTRIYPMLAPQNTLYPLIILQEISHEKVLYAEGESGLAVARVQITCWASKYLDARELADKVRLRISGYTGMMGSVYVQDCEFDNGFDQLDPSPGQDETRFFGYAQDYQVWYEQSVPDFSTTTDPEPEPDPEPDPEPEPDPTP